jgi:uncharacterized membrane protein
LRAVADGTGAPRIGVGLVLVATMFTLLVGFAHKSVCLMDEAFNERAYRYLCYSDIVPLYRDEGLADGHVPYLDVPNEYPVGTGLFMWGTAQFASTGGEFFVANAVALSVAALVTSWLLFRAVGGARSLLFALAPTLALYAFLNWDLLVVALATAATVAFVRRRDGPAGVLLGLAVAAKLYPVLLLLPFVFERRREGDARGAVRLAAWSGAAWLAVNLPFLVQAFERWAEVFRFNAERPVDWGSLWFVGCHTISGSIDCEPVRLVNALSVVLFAAGAVWVWRAKVAREPDVPRWTLGLPLIMLFLLTTKVYSPQYSLWLIPWFALVLPNLRLFVAFEAADVVVFATEFWWLGRHFNDEGLPVWPMEIAVVARAAVLVAIVVAYVRRPVTGLAASEPAGPSDRGLVHIA